MEIVIPYPKGPIGRFSLNAYYGGKHPAVRRKDAEFWHQMVKAQLYNQKIPKWIYTKPVKITFWWNDKLDIDNHAAMAKMIVDALKGWVIENDSKKYYACCEHRFHHRPYIIVEVEEWRE